jgi:hypothetical protein
MTSIGGLAQAESTSIKPMPTILAIIRLMMRMLLSQCWACYVAAGVAADCNKPLTPR